MKALVIIDFQRAVAFDPQAYDLAKTHQVLVCALARARSQSIPVVFVQHEEEGSPFEKGTEGWKLFDDLCPGDGEYLVPKKSCDSFRHTNLKRVIEEVGASTLIIGGYATEFCIDTTVRAAAAKGYRVKVMEDGHTTRDRDHLSASGIKTHHNWVWPNMTNPEHEIEVCKAADCF